MQGRNRDTDIRNECMDTGEGRGSGMNWEIGIDIYTLPCVRQVASGNLLYSTGSTVRCSVVTYMGGMVGRGSKREGIYVYIKLIHFVVQQKLTQHCKTSIPQ